MIRVGAMLRSLREFKSYVTQDLQVEEPNRRRSSGTTAAPVRSGARPSTPPRFHNEADTQVVDFKARMKRFRGYLGYASRRGRRKYLTPAVRAAVKGL